MSHVFLSHSSANKAEAIALRDWLISQGWDELFLDFDPERGLKVGERWQAALIQAQERCGLVILLVSPSWVASKWCLDEFRLAGKLNKRIFSVIVEPTPLGDLPAELAAEWQYVDLTAGVREFEATVTLPRCEKTATVKFSNDGLNRLRIGPDAVRPRPEILRLATGARASALTPLLAALVDTKTRALRRQASPGGSGTS